MSHEETWNTYIEAMALLTKAEQQTGAARRALEDAEAVEETLRSRIQDARLALDAAARREAGGLWVSLDEWSAERDPSEEPSTAASVLRSIRRAAPDDDHAGVLRSD